MEDGEKYQLESTLILYIEERKEIISPVPDTQQALSIDLPLVPLFPQ